MLGTVCFIADKYNDLGKNVHNKTLIEDIDTILLMCMKVEYNFLTRNIPIFLWFSRQEQDAHKNIYGYNALEGEIFWW